MNKLTILGHQIGFNEDSRNAAESMRKGCTDCSLPKENSNLPLSCEDGLRISFGVARCGSTNSNLRKGEDGEWQSVQGIRPGALIEGIAGGGVSIKYDADGLLINAQYLVKPSIVQKVLAKAGIDRVLWKPEDI